MPGGDGTGPRGMGSMTGRAAGFCAGFGTPGYSNFAPGRDVGIGIGRGPGFAARGGGRRGWRNMFYATGQPGWMRYGGSAMPYQQNDPTLEKHALKQQAEALQSELDDIKKRLSRILNEAEAE